MIRFHLVDGTIVPEVRPIEQRPFEEGTVTGQLPLVATEPGSYA